MALLRDVILRDPKFSNFDLSFTRAQSCCVGPLYVAFVKRCLPGDRWRVRATNIVNTYPLKSPFFSTFRQQLAFFFVPDRLYTPELDVNSPDFDPDNVPLLTNKWPNLSGDVVYCNPEGSGSLNFTFSVDNLLGAVKTSSLYNQLGFPVGFSRPRPSELTNVTASFTYNIVPEIGYYDIFLNYYANTQEPYYYFCSYANPNVVSSDDSFQVGFYRFSRMVALATDGKQSTDGTSTSASPISYVTTSGKAIYPADVNAPSYFGWIPRTLESLSLTIRAFKAGSSDYLAFWGSSLTNTTNTDFFDTCTPLGASVSTPLGGLVLRTYRPDMLNAWLSQTTYNTMVSRAQVVTSPVSSGSGQEFSINQVRFASHLLDYYERGLVAGGRYDDWIEAEFGVKTSKDLLIPELLAVFSSTIGVGTVVSTASDVGSVSGSAFGNGQLGSLAGRGYGNLEGRFSATFSEYGFLMGIYSLVPNVSYSQNLPDYLWDYTFGDLYAPAMQHVGFQPLMVTDVCALGGYRFLDNYFAANIKWPTSIFGNYTTPVIGPYGWSYGDTENIRGIAYQPAYTPLMTSLNEALGAFDVSFGDLYYWVATRNYYFFANDNFQSTIPYAYAAYSSYCVPNSITYPFANQSKFAENFLVFFTYDCFVRRAISKSVMPTIS